MAAPNAAPNAALQSTWTAVHDETPPGRGCLKVEGEVQTPTPGYKLHLTKANPQGINPQILLLNLHRNAPTGIEPQHVVTERVEFKEDTHVPYQKVQIEPDGVTVDVVNIL
ncbi:MAG: hypothetical protein JO250_05285 [Armatimonadetes bacterium]|nr:hypothetical protein [Armatimonadota bacterium]